ncbi:glycosyltransferase family 2 protein [Flavobacterium hiemivividum]|uniref:Glycosyltransferase family 2 protein n=1 Tax=Flavobacterium hiemivividum TaxID=2541734 RepID=A0A4R5D318_9FLAO|nr:glycosyltransferase family 2 protein [Flavobacterium hiemivividum]TDE04583.1 glycosyltransferase family 2 protein [Flavobacterium hiemivividum]
MKSPVVSVIIPTFNRSELLVEAISSIRKQTYKDWECIIVDDGSTDNTKIEVDKIILEDCRIQYVAKPEVLPRGAASSRNFGLELSKGNFIQWLDDDDIISENKIELQLKELFQLENKKAIACCNWDFLSEREYFKRDYIFKDKSKLTANQYFYELRKQLTYCPIHVFLIPRSLILKGGNWNVLLSLNDDAEFMCRMVIESNYIIHTDNCFAYYREHNTYPNYRISNRRDIDALESYLISLRLMRAYLLSSNIKQDAFFKWKLLNVFYDYWKVYPEVLKKQYYFFKEIGINLDYAYFYKLRYKLYKIIKPWYKRYLK